MEDRERIDFFVGSEMRLGDMLSAAEARPLLQAVVKAGAEFAAITDEKGKCLWFEGPVQRLEEFQAKLIEALAKGGANKTGFPGIAVDGNAFQRLAPVFHEGEPVGFLFVYATRPSLNPHGDTLSAPMEIARTSLGIVLRNNVKRMLTTELHTTVVNQSYEELLEANKQLSASERKYKELAENLEKKVDERTAELKMAYTRLLQQEKMASIGQLAAGIAHEINNPVGFIHSNLNTFAKYIRNLKEMLEFYRTAFARADAQPSPPPGGLQPLLRQAAELNKKLKIDFIMDDIDDLTKQSMEGSERIGSIVANLKGFSHIDESAAGEVDINTELDNTIGVLSHEIKTKGADITKNYGKIPFFHGNPGLLCQVFLNILLNALQSRESQPEITVKTEQKGETAAISISDNGRGIPHEIQGRIFEPFFTTKDVGKGMGMGLSIAYDIVTAHGGGIECRSEEGKGSVFIITLPFAKGSRTAA
ncbi:MAG TPA: ATP-binding protein [Dissulfurispiraceae bacterium]